MTNTTTTVAAAAAAVMRRNKEGENEIGLARKIPEPGLLSVSTMRQDHIRVISFRDQQNSATQVVQVISFRDQQNSATQVVLNQIPAKTQLSPIMHRLCPRSSRSAYFSTPPLLPRSPRSPSQSRLERPATVSGHVLSRTVGVREDYRCRR